MSTVGYTPTVMQREKHITCTSGGGRFGGGGGGREDGRRGRRREDSRFGNQWLLVGGNKSRRRSERGSWRWRQVLWDHRMLQIGERLQY